MGSALHLRGVFLDKFKKSNKIVKFRRGVDFLKKPDIMKVHKKSYVFLVKCLAGGEKYGNEEHFEKYKYKR